MEKIELNKVYNEDCLQGMKRIKDDSIDLICIDPPYNIKKAKWDTWKKQSDYIDFMGEVFKECERVLKPNGSFYFFHNDFLQIVELQNYINQKTAFNFKQLITWNKIDKTFKNYGYVQQRLSVNQQRNFYGGFTEYILFYTLQDETGLSKIYGNKECFKSIKKYLDEELEKSPYDSKTIEKVLKNKMASHYFGFSTRDKKQFAFPTLENYKKLQTTGYFNVKYEKLKEEYEELRKEYEELRKEYESKRYTYNVLNVKEDLRANSNVLLYPPQKQNGHITPKPVALIENIIKHSSNEGDVVLDCFMGSFTTAIAARNLKRNYIGFEKDETYYKLGMERLEEGKNPAT